MKRFIEESKAQGKKIKPHQALIIFLKFMSSVMPTVRYEMAPDIEIWFDSSMIGNNSKNLLMAVTQLDPLSVILANIYLIMILQLGLNW